MTGMEAKEYKKWGKMMWQTGYQPRPCPWSNLYHIWHVQWPPGRVSKFWVSNRSVPKFRSYGGSKIAHSHWQDTSLNRLYRRLLLPHRWRRPPVLNQLNGHKSAIFERIRAKFESETENEVPQLVLPAKSLSCKIQDGGITSQIISIT